MLEDYILYMDLIYNGSVEEKNRISFMMIDEIGNGKITLPLYENFWIQFLQMYGELLQMKVEYDEQSEEVTKNIF